MISKYVWRAPVSVLSMMALCGLLACGGDGKGEPNHPIGPDPEPPGSSPGRPGDDGESPPEREPWSPPPDASFGARVKAPKVDVPTRNVGQACSSWGAGDCKGNICLRVAPLPRPLDVCTRACGSHLDCPSSWECRPARPGGPSLCVPPMEVARQLRRQNSEGAQ
jgi:hypothetical protein